MNRPGSRGPIPKPLMERMAGKIIADLEGGCWIWQGQTNCRGYGVIKTGSLVTNDRRMALAHRVAYEIWVGPIPAGLNVCHSCDVPRCCNPTHFFLGTNADNDRDRDAKGRGVWPTPMYGESNPRSVLTAEQVEEIKKRFASGGRQNRSAIAREFSVCPSAIGRIFRGETWKMLR